ncbi:MAG: hypothetical protein EOO38_17750, partial [Cytophagaceae bacterium]
MRDSRYLVEVGTLGASAQTPFWLRANRYGVVPLKSPYGWVNAGLWSDYRTADSLRKRPKADWGYGVNAVVNATDSRTEMINRYAESCPDHRYTTRLLSADPLIMYVEDMVTKEEADYLLVLAEPHYMPSPLSGPMGRTYDNEYRKSVSAVLPDDPVVACIRQRAAEFQGFMPVGHVEDIQLVKYGMSDQFRPHYDWHQGMMNPRISTFFVYIACDDPINGGTCEGGETGFPRWTGFFATAWCK